jgi:hypothetical protein
MTTPNTDRDMSGVGANNLSFWINTPVGLSFTAIVSEGSSGGADAEEWGARVSVNGTGAWQKITIPFTSLVSSGGNGILDLQSINYIWFDLLSHGGVYSTSPDVGVTVDPAVDFYIDDIAFEP